MKPFIPVLMIMMLILGAMQTDAQQYLVLQKKGKLKNFKYETGSKISLKTRRGNFNIEGRLTQIGDTSIVIDHSIEIGVTNIVAIYRSSGFLNRLSTLFFIQGGIAYFLIDGTNRAINQEYPVIDESTLLISGTMIATGFALRPFITRKFDIPEKWEIKILNFDVFKKE